MKHHNPALRRPARRLAVAVAVALAVTAGTAAATAPAVAAPGASAAGAAGTAAEEETAPFVVRAGSTLSQAGGNTFTTWASHPDGLGPVFQWHRISDGTTVDVPWDSSSGYALPAPAAHSELLAVQTQKTTYRIQDMSGRTVADVDTSAAGAGATLWLFTGDTLVMRTKEADGRFGLRLFSVSAGGGAGVPVTGLSAATRPDQKAYSSGSLAFPYDGTTGKRLAVVDLATAKVVLDRPVSRYNADLGIALTPTHLAWTETSAGSSTLMSAALATGETKQHITVPGNSRFRLGPLGDWILYGTESELRAVSLKDGTTVTGLLPAAPYSTRSLHASDVGVLLNASTPESGDGVYRIALGADGRPSATVVATMGVTTPTTVLTEQVPATADFRRAGSKATLRWTYGRSDVWVTLGLTHRATGKEWWQGSTLKGTETEAVIDWNGLLTDRAPAPNGVYDWKMTVKPLGGIGGTVVRTGTLKVDSGAAAHGYSDTGTADLLVRDERGHLFSYGTRQILDPWSPDWTQTPRGGGWYVYDRLLSAGNLDANPYSDVLAREKSTGVLWFYSGKGTTLATRTQVGRGWNAYTTLAAGSDLTGDGRPDLVATDKDGVLWLYKATGDGAKPFAARKRIGGGWGTYNLLTAPGDIGGAKTGDLLARDRDGVLWLYLGKGDGTFAPRTRVGGGWGAFNQIVNIGDADRDGRADLIAESGTKQDPWLTLYKGTGNWKAPFAPAKTIGIPSYESRDTTLPRALPF
ncbi:FG-GAP repeat domain-containing protein [Streptomyces filamentosus]